MERKRQKNGMALLCGLIAGILLLLSGCRSDTNKDLAQAWQYCAEKKFEAAVPLLRDYLGHYPRNPAAHFLLGKCFANRTPAEYTRAKGEFDMACFLYEAGDYAGVPDATATPESFLAEIHYETSQVLLRIVIEAQNDGIAAPATLNILNAALKHANEGLRLNPEFTALANLKSTLEKVIRSALGFNAHVSWVPSCSSLNPTWTKFGEHSQWRKRCITDCAHFTALLKTSTIPVHPHALTC